MDGPSQLKDVFFESTLQNLTPGSEPYVAFRVEVQRANDSYALIHLRYSVLLALHESLVKKYPAQMKDAPVFPAKTWGSPSDAQWKERCSSLNAYFEYVLGRAELARDEEVVAMFARHDSARDWTPDPALSLPSAADEEQRFRFADLETGLKMGYIERGKREDPLVLFVHGFPDTLWTWDKVMERVAEKGMWCVSVAQRGYYPSGSAPEPSGGQQQPPQPVGDWERYGKLTLARDLLAVIRALKKKNATLVGHDWGAVACWAAAVLDQRHGEGLVGKVVGESVPPPKAIAYRPGLVMKARHIVYYNAPLVDPVKGTKENNFVYLEQLLERWSPTWKPPQPQRFLRTVKRHMAMPGRTEAAIAYYRALTPSKEDKELYDALNQTDIKCPVLFVCGEEESGGGMVDMFKQTATQCAGFCEVVVVREAGHFVHAERMAGFLHKLIPFLEMNQWPDGKQVKIKFVQENPGVIHEPKKIQ